MSESKDRMVRIVRTETTKAVVVMRLADLEEHAEGTLEEAGSLEDLLQDAYDDPYFIRRIENAAEQEDAEVNVTWAPEGGD